MVIIAGLGNPGEKYAKTRHNMGFRVIEALAEKYRIAATTQQCRAFIGKGVAEGERVLLAQPQTFMNNSGESVRALCDYYKVDPKKELIVIYDDISLPPGNIRIREKGSAGGHNGIKSIIEHLGHEEFLRVRVGIGEKPPQWDLADYVLGCPSAEDAKLLEDAWEDAADAVGLIVREGPMAAMNRYNSRKK